MEKPWYDAYKDYLTSIGKHAIITPSNECYKFGNDGQKKSLFAAVIPIYIFRQNLNFKVDVISSTCPLLMGRPTLMAKMLRTYYMDAPKEVEMMEATNPLITTRWFISTKENDNTFYIKARLVKRFSIY